MKPRGYRTQCDSGGMIHPWDPVVCPETRVLDKPAVWRCDDCVRKHGPIDAPPNARPTAPYP